MSFSILRKLQNKINADKFYQDNKDIILIRSKTIINCDCGGKYQVANKWNHFKTDKHKNLNF
jgi:hypothetical protein